MTQESLAALVERLGITAKSTRTPARPGAEKAWPEGSTHWRVTLRLGKRRVSSEFHQGPAHKGEPVVADVLSCLLLDASSGGESFEDFCGNFGYSTDSISAKSTWLQCVRISHRLREFLAEHYEALEAASQDY
jgi:hypothetical protein